MARVRKTKLAVSLTLLAALIYVFGCASGNNTANSGPNPTPTPTPTPAPSSHSVEVMWDPSPSNNLQGYKVYRSQVTGGPYTPISSVLDPSILQFSDSSVFSGQTYFYVVTSLDVDGAESAQSSEVSAAVPTS